MASHMKAKHELYENVLGQKWEKVVEIIKEHPYVQSTKITKSEDNVLHLAITLDAPEAIVLELIDEIEKKDREVAMEIITAKNKQDDTPLHLAASRGSIAICGRILPFDDEKLVLERNKEGETPLFLAALNGHKHTFQYLHSVCSKITTTKFSGLWKRKNGDTILHCAIQREYFELAYHIICLYGDDVDENIIVSYENKEGVTPLQVLASVPSAFKSGTRLTCFQQLLYWLSCLSSEDLEEQLENDDQTQNQDVEVGNSNTSKINEATTEQQCLEMTTRRLKGSTKKIKEKHLWGRLIMDKLLELNSEYRYDENQIEGCPSNVTDHTDQGKSTSSKKDNRSTALLVATKYGLLEVVERILEALPVAIYDKTEPTKRNVVHTAVQKRQTHVLRLLMKHALWDKLIEEVDADGNNVLHMAAFLPKHMPWEVHGSAMQMQYEAKWFQYVKEHVPPYLYAMENKDGDTPEEIYVAEHKKLLKESNEWIKDTSSSYSIVATLTAGVTYATSYTVPGGSNDQTGRPPLEGQFALNVFLIAIFVSFCFSVTSLAAFLGVYSSRKQPDDFRRNLPLKLCFALTSFYVAIVSMMVSFCAAHSLEVDPRIQAKVTPMYTLIFIPLLFYTLGQIPLYWDLLRASFKKIPQPRYVGESITITIPKKRSKLHEKLLTESNKWIKHFKFILHSCRALGAGVTYATSYTVPGGSNDVTGRPALEGQFALHVFVVAIFVSFCFSITSLAVYSSRKKPDDFRKNLPLKMCFALTSFYVAVVSTMVSFCAAHSLEVDPRIEAKVTPSIYSSYDCCFTPWRRFHSSGILSEHLLRRCLSQDTWEKV